MKIALVDDNNINRSNFLQKVSAFEDLDVCVVAADGNEFLDMIKGLPLSKLPEVVFMDIQMPALNGIDTIRIAKALHNNMHFIVLTVFEDEDTIFDAIAAGASGYLLKHESYLTIREAIVEITEYGGAPMSPAIARKTMELLRNAAPPVVAEKTAAGSVLSDREMEILKEMVTGKNYKAIGEKLFISPLTVRKHTANIYEKLHVNSRAQVINLAHKNKWI